MKIFAQFEFVLDLKSLILCFSRNSLLFGSEKLLKFSEEKKEKLKKFNASLFT